MCKPLIVLKDLVKKFGRTTAVNKISMSIGTGEIFGFLGANGAGKTTTIRMLCGLTKPRAATRRSTAWMFGRIDFAFGQNLGTCPRGSVSTPI
jgi:ABC-type multidrug transport system ATPase subunit